MTDSVKNYIESRLNSLNRQDPLERINKIIPWEEFREVLEKVLLSEKRSRVGRKPLDVVLMFKIVILQNLYKLADGQTEYQIRDRLTFARFFGLTSNQSVPDEKTIWLFKERIKKSGIFDKVFAVFEEYLQDNGYQAREGTLIDASLVQVPKQRNKRWENPLIKKGWIPKHWYEKPYGFRKKDTDARWTQKYCQRYYGYKNHVAVDGRHNLIRKYEITSASTHDIHLLPQLIDEKNPEKEIFADSAYYSEETIDLLLHKQCYNRIMQRPANNILRKEENAKMNRIGCRIEHVFGFMANSMKGKYIRTIGLARAQLKIGFMNLVYNFCRLEQLSRVGKRYYY